MRFNTALLISIPLISAIRQEGDEGAPCALYPTDRAGRLFQALAISLTENHLKPVANLFEQVLRRF